MHEDYLGVQSAYEAMLDVSSYVNEVKRDNEMLQIISDVQESISGWNPEMAPLKEYGRLIKDGELKIRSHEDGNRQKLRYVFVFNRAVIFCKTNRVTICFIFFFSHDKNPKLAQNVESTHLFTQIFMALWWFCLISLALTFLVSMSWGNGLLTIQRPLSDTWHICSKLNVLDALLC